MTTTIETTDWIDGLRDMSACTEALMWARTQPDPETAWNACERPDWMFWLVRKVGCVERSKIVLAACACARTALKYIPEGEERPRIAIETAERYVRGEATLAEVKVAAADAADAAYAAYAAYAAVADDAAAYADAYAYAYAYAADAAVADAYAYAYADAYADAYAYAGKQQAYREMAVLVREHISYQDVSQ